MTKRKGVELWGRTRLTVLLEGFVGRGVWQGVTVAKYYRTRVANVSPPEMFQHTVTGD